MKHRGLWVSLLSVGAWIAAAAQQPTSADRGALLQSLPQVSELPAGPGLSGTFTTHMYFIPEETYLAWDKEPSAL